MIFEKVTSIISENLMVEVEELKMETTFEELEVDSLDLYQIIIEIEDEFKIKIENPENLKSIKDLVSYIEEKAE